MYVVRDTIPNEAFALQIPSDKISLGRRLLLWSLRLHERGRRVRAAIPKAPTKATAIHFGTKLRGDIPLVGGGMAYIRDHEGPAFLQDTQHF